ncbi:unnamed protein product [Thlaspi arvense]|uniref:Uncharacterized protein n=1 Tax=Thlaspi arvense TaxID=13288 RepID=A0AAU9T6R8_THLAR|nr:unnamed protein product [Thlaspi arvense]
MDADEMESERADQVSACALPFARSYQVEALEKAIKQNTIVFLETGSGKTLIAIMLLRSYAYLFRKPSPCFSVFLVPQVVLVTQQGEALKMHTDLKVGMYWGDMGVDFWDSSRWKQEVDKYEVLVMTPAILLDALRHSFLKLNMIKVLIVDECHHAGGKHPYACIMREFYHKDLSSGISDVPRIFGMTASLVKTKGAKLDSYWEKIHELETLMNSKVASVLYLEFLFFFGTVPPDIKVYTCENESVLAGFVPFSTPSFKYYHHMEIPCSKRASLVEKLEELTTKHCLSLATLDLKSSIVGSIEKRLHKISLCLTYCLDDLGILLAQMAAQSLSASQNDFVFRDDQLDMFSETLVKKFCSDASQAFLAYIPPGQTWSIANIKENMEAGLLTSKTVCLIETLLGYSSLENIRCIVFVERVITAIVVESLLAEILKNYNNKWKPKYVAGSSSALHSQTRKKQNEIVEEFRRGLVNIIVATSILEEGLDVQSCNLVVTFDPASNICSFIQSRGRARMLNSDYLMLVESGALLTQSRLMKYLSGGERMRQESLHHSLVPCPQLPDDSSEDFFRVESTGAIVTLSSSVSLIYFYCSRLPSDEYFKPAPRFDINKDHGICTLYLPKSCPVKEVRVEAKGINVLKQSACLEACVQLHKVGALTDYLVPDMVVAETVVQKLEDIHYNTEQPCYFPEELVSKFSAESQTTYHLYLIRMKPDSPRNFQFNDISLGTRIELEDDTVNTSFQLEDHSGTIAVTLSYVGAFDFTQEEVLLCRKFQTTLFQVLLDHSVENFMKALDVRDGAALDYLLVPSTYEHETSLLIDWEVIRSVSLTCHKPCDTHVLDCCSSKDASRNVHTKDGMFCTCVVQNALVYTPHNGKVYITKGVLNNLNANSLMNHMTYIEHYEKRHKVRLNYVDEPLLNGRHIFTLHNHLRMFMKEKKKEHDREFVELPPELCHIMLSPISVDLIYTYTFIPSVMLRIESLLLAYTLKKSISNVNIPTFKILEAITTKKCQDQFHLESLETLGDSFLKYAVCKQLFLQYRTHHEGLLSKKKDAMISNVTLCKFACQQKLQGFIRNECFEPKGWMVPGQSSSAYDLVNDTLPDSRNIYIVRMRNLKFKRVADVVEALIGAYLSEGGEVAALMFMSWVGIKVDFTTTPIQRDFSIRAEKLVNVGYMESLLRYRFKDKSLLVEALTHGSYMKPEIPRCYQRLEFLGDSVLDYLITKHLYDEYPSLSPGLLTDMRSASVNNECYAQVAVKASLHKHVLHASHDLHKDISRAVCEFERSSLQSTTFGWESEISFSKVLGDVIESLAGSIFVDSGYNKEAVFASIKPLLGCMVTPETVKLHPVRELTELCQKAQYELSKAKGFENGKACFTVDVNAQGKSFTHTAKASNKEMAKKLAYKQVLISLKENLDS